MLSNVLVCAGLAATTIATPLNMKIEYVSDHEYSWEHDTIGVRVRDALLSTQRARYVLLDFLIIIIDHHQLGTRYSC